jgi:hypothetical protein
LKHSIFRKRHTLFSRMYFYFIFRLFLLFFCEFRLMPQILIQEESPSFIFRSRKFFIFMTHDFSRRRDLHIHKKFY